MISRHDLIKIYRISVVATAIVAVLVCGGLTTGRQIQVVVAPTDAVETPPVELSAVDRLVEAAPDEDQVDGQMATNTSRRGVSTAYFLTGLMAKTASDESRLPLLEWTATPLRTRTLTAARQQALLVSSAEVDSALGRQFTLVGAKPSGTS